MAILMLISNKNFTKHHFNEINHKRIKSLKLFEKNINITIQDFIEFDASSKYDLVASNPPYAKFNDNVRVSKNHNLARDSIKNSRYH